MLVRVEKWWAIHPGLLSDCSQRDKRGFLKEGHPHWDEKEQQVEIYRQGREGVLQAESKEALCAWSIV